jgi:hypothetical protein
VVPPSLLRVLGLFLLAPYLIRVVARSCRVICVVVIVLTCLKRDRVTVSGCDEEPRCDDEGRVRGACTLVL